MYARGLQLLALAKALNVDIGYFARPFDFNIEDLNVSFRRKASVGVKVLIKRAQSKLVCFAEREKRGAEPKGLEALKVSVQDDVERYLEVEALLGLKPDSLDRLTASPVSTADDVRRLARLLRDKWELGCNPILNVQELLESKGIKVLYTKGPEGFDGVSGIINKGDCRFYVVVLNPSVGMCERRRLTALHELGHLLLNDSFAPDLTPKDVEKLCNTFANEMLFPEEVARGWFDAKRHIQLPELKYCQQTFGISIEAIVYKLHELGIMNDARFKTFSVLKNTRPLLKRAVSASLFREAASMRLEALVYKALSEGLVSKERAAVLLNQQVTDVEFNTDSV